MRHLWILLVAIGLLIAGSLSLIPHADSMALGNPEPASPLIRPLLAQPALSMAGLPSLLPEQPSAHGAKVLPSADEAAENSRFLSNRQYIDHAGELLRAQTQAFDRHNEHVRMRAVAYLANAAHWAGNPERDAVFATVDEAIQADNATTPSEARQRKSIAGDKVELFEILLREAPDRAAQLEKGAEGTWLQPILHHAHTRFDLFTHIATR